MRGNVAIEDELEEFRVWRQQRLARSPLEEAFDSLERIIENPFYRGYDSAFRLMMKCLVELKLEMERRR